MELHEAVQTIMSSNGKFFTVKFVKKDGSERVMNCRLGVRKGVKGVGMSYDPLAKGLLPVFEMKNDNFRMINLKTLLELNGQPILDA